MTIKIIVFDFDGTLADTKKTWVSSIKQALDKHRLFFDIATIEKNLGPKLSITFQNLGVSDPHNKISQEVHEQIMKKINKVKPCPYIKETLKYFKKTKKIKVVLLTNTIRRITIALLKKIRILNFFDEVYCADDFDTKDQMLVSLARKNNVKVKDIAYIGDKVYDISIGKKAKCIYYIVLECAFDKPILKKRKEKFIVKEIRQLKKIV